MHAEIWYTFDGIPFTRAIAYFAGVALCQRSKAIDKIGPELVRACLNDKNYSNVRQTARDTNNIF